MKKLVLALMMAGLATLPAALARAAAPAECGKTYAVLMVGDQESTNRATGGSGLPGALSQAVGVGSITFGAASGTSCNVASGELIFNSGDLQTNPAGDYFGPAVCYPSVSALGTGLPCFDGGNHVTAGSIAPSANDGNSLQLSVTFTYAWLDGTNTAGSQSFGFTVQNNTGGSIIVGTSNPGSGAPVLSLTLQKIGTTTNSTPAVPTAFGTAPYLGNSSLGCQAWGANDTDFVAALNDAAPAVSGAYESTVGMLEIFNAAQAGGSLSFNGNDNFGSTTVPNSNDDCSFTDVPGNECSAVLGSCGTEPSSYGNADGTSNSIAFVGSSGNNCGNATVAGAGYATSAVVYGTTYGATYTEVTGLFSSATGFVPPGGESYCAGYSSAPAGTVTILTVPTSQTVLTYPGTKSTPIKVTSTSPADCDIEASLVKTSGSATVCSASLSSTAFDVNGGTVSDTQTVNCTCSAKTPSETDVYSLNYSSAACPIKSGAGPITFTCKN